MGHLCLFSQPDSFKFEMDPWSRPLGQLQVRLLSAALRILALLLGSSTKSECVLMCHQFSRIYFNSHLLCVKVFQGSWEGLKQSGIIQRAWVWSPVMANKVHRHPPLCGLALTKQNNGESVALCHTPKMSVLISVVLLCSPPLGRNALTIKCGYIQAEEITHDRLFRFAKFPCGLASANRCSNLCRSQRRAVLSGWDNWVWRNSWC